MLTGSQQQELLSSAESTGEALDSFDRAPGCSLRSLQQSLDLFSIGTFSPDDGLFESQQDGISRMELSTRH